MYMKRIVIIAFLICAGLVFAVPSRAEELPSWVKQWQDWAKSTGNQDFIEWGQKLASPEAIKLGKEWEEFLGYNAVDMVAKDTKAPEHQARAGDHAGECRKV